MHHLDPNDLARFSPFAHKIYQKNPNQADAFWQMWGDKALTQTDFEHMIITHMNGQKNWEQIDESVFMNTLRIVRNLLMLKWIYQDIHRLVSLEQLTQELSEFANVCLCLSHDFVRTNLITRYGKPTSRFDDKMTDDELMIIAMGKLGAGELNLSSDIDLVFVHVGTGETDGRKTIENQKFMTNLGRGIIRLLSEVTEHGFVFRIDMRLRPWGDGSPLVMTLPALEKYFAQHGRTWERFAWLKSRLVNDVDGRLAQRLLSITKNFVYRYYIDYTAFSALREMKAMIVAQQNQRQDNDNIKLGVGGIRDIEFIVQSFLLIYGGHHAKLGQNLTTLTALDRLCELGFLPQEQADELGQAYRFLRRLEHAIQARHDEQTQRLPTGDELLAVAMVMGFETVDKFLEKLNNHRQNVSTPFNTLITDRQNPTDELTDSDDVWVKLATLLNNESMTALKEFATSRQVSLLDDEPKKRFDDAYPILLHALYLHAKTDPVLADIAVPRLITLLEAIVRRSIYLVMIAENPNATIALIPMLSASPWIAKELALHPMLLDNFLQKRYLHLPNLDELTDILRQQVLRVEPFDDETYLSVIRHFKKTQVLAVATADILGLRHIMKVSDSLTFIAQVVLSSALQRAFDELITKHGFPKLQTGERASSENMGVAIVGYGKLGGLEMSYASDLDVVFLHQLDEQADTDGQKAVSGMKFASRLVQKVLNYLTTQTRDGRAYEMDMRLRPSGNAGVMIVSVHAFEIYQHQKAWAWEHQALVRGRGIVGDKAVLAEFDRIRLDILKKPRDIDQVRQDVINMRQKMQEHLGTKTNHTHEFHLKQDGGGLVDIEFLAQFMVLAFAHKYPNLAVWSDNVRIFEEVAKTGLWEQERCQKLTEAYLDLRKKTHELALSDQTVIVQDDAWDALRNFVCTVWLQVMN
ncbi:bifunctional [glutamate--ammonia ligase]-adenylyl-L-tyrosine phosphorylase/[glutamate--ammonia-ligase] adenylyltransferase [Moraxella oblonga]|uniref:bifunctional [glutamate--ammonia ligase]-adenylyl-L-tyrosine phosphorylase/[glutamate--ammonia-ligase] adenylyltransferase n=1 Tax=Moraxella oblonga TaxID=200413 RepID=UPI000836E706|nr:bifunctional [glutamate--ammonia ligase]-adenylyl-L-tyrosine phosphorylase/[glutamate--ammonia-ligase] adenylyltransferase [Moraxella oblonga]